MTDSLIAWADSARAGAFGAWLQASTPTHGLLPETLQLASADASFRRYFRICTADGASCIIMDAPPAQENCQPFVQVAALMAEAGLNAPRVLAWDQPQGFMLLSDLGAQTMLDVIAQQPEANKTQRAYTLYRDAVDALISWQLASRPDVLPAYDEALLSRELALFPDWYVAKHRSITLDAAAQATLDKAFAQIKASNLQSLNGARVYVHRDFMPRNLMLDSNGQLGILDFQDAVYGPITYDIASLMRDAFISWPEDFVLEITVRYWEQARKAGLPVGDDFGEFYRAVEWMGLQRHLKILGIFARLTLRDGKPKYLADTPRFINYARSTCARYRQLGPLMVLLDQIEGNETRVGYTF
ncbi:aminoglycoside phosphotransferase family protein [Polaromonas sp. SM01]|uniref:aminoglycoside phosphotransferase family protein n=1 Tax=Polaromonas sp. SM01 TaxID=3085630 RepID=UPI0029812CC8|nr:phosphotransferase [Polaromonas sp. SM01]MDW5441199.1 phosphotransferase [Polaromonas sp. SM01]